MVRVPDHRTSITAATRVHRLTLRDAVLEAAHEARERGITDDELKVRYPDTPESSVRKRRTELTQENVLLDSGRVRKNRHGQEEKVWMHRAFHFNPPPLTEREQPISKAQQIVTLEARVRGLEHAIRQAIEQSGGASFAAYKMADILTAAL
jgi:hypothetical protein